MSEVVITLLAGIILLLLSTRTFLRQSETLSRAFKLSPLIIGMTVVAIGTSIPELSVSAIASARGDISLAVGNIVGSNIVNILLVFAVAILIGNLRIGTTKTPRNAIILLLVTLGFTASYSIDFYPRYLIGLFLIISSIFLTLLEYKWAIFGKKHEDVIKLRKYQNEKFSAAKIIMLFLSIIGVIVGAFIVVGSTEEISSLTGISTGILGLTLTSIATSLPELLTTIFSQESHDEKMTIGNILGSNLYNLLLIGGLVELFSSGNGGGELPFIDWIILNCVTLLFVIFIYVFKGKTIPKYYGLILILLFVGYLYLQTFKFI